MTKPFYERLHTYFEGVASVLRGESEAASIFPNPSDIGHARERLYLEFLRLHAPSKCNVFFGGFLFQFDGSESKQIDVIVTHETAPRFDLHNPTGTGKSFSPVEGTLAVASLKSKLDKAELCDALEKIASIPATSSLNGRCAPNLNIHDYSHWPLKIIYAVDGIAVDTLESHLSQYYSDNPEIPATRRPDIIHVAGKYALVSGSLGFEVVVVDEVGHHTIERVGECEHITLRIGPDVQAMSQVIQTLQRRAGVSHQILTDYSVVVERLREVSVSRFDALSSDP